MSDDMSNIMDTINQMLNSGNVPDDIKNIVNNISNNNSNASSDYVNEENDNTSENSGSEFDINTMLKMKSIIDAMNNQKNDPRATLLQSLKPYLKDSRKEKVDQYIKLFSMGKAFEMFGGSLGGEKKNDV